MLKKIIHIFTYILFICISQNVLANEPSSHLQVEVIVFKNLYSEKSQEAWVLPDPFILPSPCIHIGDPAYPALSAKQFKLGWIYHRLKNSSRYQPLLHLAWQQPVPEQNALPIYLEQNPEFEGSLTLSKNKFYHLDVNLYFNASDHKTYQLEQSLKILPDNVYYFDHPYFGMLVQISLK